MSPGIGLMKRRLEKEKDAIALAISGIAKEYDKNPEELKTLETKYHSDAGDWYVALGWDEKKAIVKMDSVLGNIADTNGMLDSETDAINKNITDIQKQIDNLNTRAKDLEDRLLTQFNTMDIQMAKFQALGDFLASSMQGFIESGKSKES